MRHLLLVATLHAALSPIATAQTPPPDGPLVGLQLAFSIDPATPVGAAGTREAQPYWKRNGSRSGLPTPTSTVLANFAPSLVFGPYMAPPYPDIDAMSMGLDFIPADSFGVVSIDFGHWNFLAFSVRRGTAGELGGAINAEVGTAGGNEADFFHYVFRGASCIPPEFVDRTFKLADSSEVALPAGSEVDGADLMMSLMPLENAIPGIGLPVCPFPCPVVYYSFTAATLGRVPPTWWNSTPISGATVFSSTWNGTGWSAPTVAYTPGQLGLQDCEDVDALAIDLYDPRGIQILFSATSSGCVVRDQLMFLQCACDNAIPVPLRYSTGEPVSSRIGIDRSRQEDDVDAICIGDPICRGGSHFWEPVRYERIIGYPWAGGSTFGLTRGLAVQALREPLSIGAGFRYTLFVTGGHPGGPGAWFLWDPLTYPFAAPLQLFFAVPAVSPFPGNPVQSVVTFPAALFGIDIVMQAATLGLAPPDVRVSHPLYLTLY